jgi:uncharacterized protein (TIGR02001 family)
MGAASFLAVALIAGPALADGMPKRGKVRAPEPAPRACALSANVALTTDYIFRGFSQSAETPAIQGGFDATCGIFYAGVWASSIDFGVFPLNGPDENIASIEVDFYAGIKPQTGPITWDLGVIYYTYPDAFDPTGELNYVEVKVGASGTIWKDGTLGVTVFYSPEYTGETGDVWTVEAGFSQALPSVGMFSPTFSALLGYQTGNSDAWRDLFANGDDSYLYWNAGLTLGFHEKWSLDLRYWDTDISNSGGFCTGDIFQCDSRFVATLKFAY